MIIISLIFIISSLFFVFILTITKVTNINIKYRYSVLKIVLDIIVYLIITGFLSYLYTFRGTITSDNNILVNPYIAAFSLFLQFINIVTFVDVWYRIMIERLNKKNIIFVLNIIFNLIVILGNIITYKGFIGMSDISITTDIKIINNLSRIILYIPFITYDLNLINLNITLRKKRDNV